jgi:HAE1 family hydrophobic/amphiphilic exporter-1
MVAIVLGVIVFVVNAAKGKFRPQLILYAGLFGLIFPVAAVAGGFFGAWKKDAPFKFEFIPVTDGNQINVSIKMPPNSSLARTQRVVEQIEQVVEKNPSVKYVVSNLGDQGVGGFSGVGNSGSNYAQVSATLYDRGAFLDRIKHQDEKLRWVSDTQVAAEILQAVGRIPSAQLKVAATGGNGFGSPIQMSFRSENHDLLVQTANNIKVGLQNGAIKGVINADVSTTPGKPEFRAVPKREELADNHLTVSDIGTAMRTMYQGDDTARFRVEGKEYRIRVQLSPKDKNNPDIVNEAPVSFRGGNPIVLSSVADLQTAASVDRVQRRDRQQEVQVTADLLPGYAAGTVQTQIDAWIAKEHLLPPGVTNKALGAADAQARESGFILVAFLLGPLLVYMLLASLYDNLLYPFIIQLAQPQALTGAILALVLTDHSFNLIGFIGLVVLVGLVGKNAILLVDYTNTLRGRGRNRHDALVEAGPTRLRPIMMTTLALLVGTMPIAFAIGRGSQFRESIGIVIIGGMIVSTILTLVLIPCSYTIFDDWSESMTKRRRRREQRAGLPPARSSDDVSGEAEAEDEAEMARRDF